MTTSTQSGRDCLRPPSTTELASSISSQSTQQLLYVYEFLHRPRSIRLLQIVPAQVPTSVVKCSLVTVLLDQAPSFTAVSYCWGPENPQHVIEIDGARLSIRDNLHEFLLQIRSSTPRTVYYWIDAICINQEDLDERSEQVQFMRDIFAGAERTIVWLGVATQDSNIDIELLRSWDDMYRYVVLFQEYCREARLSEVEVRSELISTECSPLIAELLINDETERVDAWVNFFDSPWWTRVWVFQEYVVSSNVVFICGHQHINDSAMRRLSQRRWDTLLDRIAWLSIALNPKNVSFAATTARLGRIYVWRYFVMRHQRILETGNGNPKFGLLTLLCETWKLEATDPRDKLYAILGLQQLKDIQIQVDYEGRVEDVYASFSAEFVRAGNLAILPAAGTGFGGAHRGIPSWVLDLRLENATHHICDWFSASASRSSQAVVTGCNLKASGIICDSVIGVGDCPSHQTDDIITSWSWWKLIFRSQYTQTHPTGVPPIQVFFRTLGQGASDEGNSQILRTGTTTLELKSNLAAF